MKRTIPRLMTSAVGVLLILTAFVAKPDPETGGGALVRAFDYIDSNFSVWFNLLAVFALILGGGNLLKNHASKVLRRRPDWGYSVVTLVAFAVVLVVGMFKIGGPPGLQGEATDPAALLTRIFTATYDPLMSTLWSLLAFFVASAAYRAFRLRSLEASVLLVAAFVVLLGRTPLGTWLSELLPRQLAFLRVDIFSVWLLRVPSVAGQRAILIGIALGVAALTLRILFGRGHKPGGTP